MFYFKRVENKEELNECLSIRQTVFVKEQNIDKNIEFDGLDDKAIHIIAYDEDKPIGTLRILKINDEQVKIGRVAVIKEYRNKGIGTNMMEFANILLKDSLFKTILLGAQKHAINFYLNIGYEIFGEEFLEANIVHVHMIKNL